MSDFWRGFRAVVPLWLGMIPFGAAYAVSARAGGLSLFETQLMSLIVFAGGAQFSAAGLFAANASPLTLIATTFLINARHLLYGVSLGQLIPMRARERLLAAHFLTDEAYGVTVASPLRNVGFFLGAGSGVFFSWNLSTLLGSLLSGFVPDPAALGIDFIFPLAFLALLIPLLRSGQALGVAVFAGALALLASQVMNTGLVVLLAGVLGPLLGAWLTKGERA
jgi:4-azaleucine resistance transporter AzlC